jgi:transcription antitermination factor NusG
VVEHEPGRYDHADGALYRAGFERFRPLRRIEERVAVGVRRRGPCAQRTGGYKQWVRRDEPLFPGYVFVRLARRDDLGKLFSVRYVSSILSGAGDEPVEVPADVMLALFRRHEGRHAAGVSQKSPFVPGAPVKVASGPFQGVEGVYDGDAGVDAVTVLFDMMGAIRRVSIPTDNVANK